MQHQGLVRRQRASRSSTATDDGDTLGTLIDSALPVASSTPVVASTTNSRTAEPVESSTTTTSSTSTTASADPVTIESSTTASSVTSTVTVIPSSTVVEPTSSSLRRSTVFVVPSTNLIINSITQSASVSAAEASTPPKSSDGPGAGVVVGIVAGGLVAIVVLSGFIGYFFKARFAKDKDEDFDDAVFNRRSFRRDSQMLPDDDAMSMRSGSAAGTLSNLGRNNTGLPGMGRNGGGGPRPPSILERHYMSASPAQPHFPPPTSMPSFEPGQIINPGFYGANGSNNGHGYGQDNYGYSNLHPSQAAAQQQYYAHGPAGLDRSNTNASYYPEEQRAPSAQSQYADLHRQASQASQYTADYHGQPQQGNSYPPQPAHSRQLDPFAGDRPLSGIQEDDDAEYTRRPASPQEIPNGMYHHQQSDSAASIQYGGVSSAPGSANRAQKTLSIRNGGLDDYYNRPSTDSSPYGGM